MATFGKKAGDLVLQKCHSGRISKWRCCRGPPAPSKHLTRCLRNRVQATELTQAGISKDEADVYAEGLRRGGAVVGELPTRPSKVCSSLTCASRGGGSRPRTCFFVRNSTSLRQASSVAPRSPFVGWLLGLKSSRLLLCRENRRFSGYVARQSQRPQPRGLFTRGQTGCLVFGHCLLTLSQPLFLFLENRFGSITCLVSVDVQLRYSFSGEPAQRTNLPGGPDAVCRCGVGQLSQRRSR
jgi:hypothetical protein